MAKIVLECQPPTIPFEKKTLYIEEGNAIRIGRPSGKNEKIEVNNALFCSPLVSSTHALLVYSKGRFFLKDQSKNGTFINGFKLRPNVLHEVTSGDTIELGFDVFYNTVNVQGVIIFIKLFPPDEESPEIRERLKKEYPHMLLVYDTVPLDTIHLEEAYQASINRLRALKIISKLSDQDSGNRKWISTFISQLREENLSELADLLMGSSVSSREEYARRRGDQFSHFILLAGCCLSNSNRMWFLNQEAKIIRVKWHFLSPNERASVLEQVGLQFKKISDERKLTLLEKSGGFLDEKEDYYEVDYREGAELLKNRLAVISNGKIFATAEQLVSPLCKLARERVSSKLKIIKANYGQIEADERLRPIISKIKNEACYNNVYTFGTSQSRKMSPSDIDEASKKSFPLCMQVLQHNLKTHNHLRNFGRLQFNLFLKGIGVSLIDAINFWRYHFTKRISFLEFKRHYLYHIKHQYGEVGRQADYQPMNCDKIFESNPGPLDYHGCPFKVCDRTTLMGALETRGLKGEDAEAIWQLVENGTPLLACAKYFQVVHGTLSMEIIDHPNKYYMRSQMVLSGIIDGSNKPEGNKFSKLKRQCICGPDLDW